jgi:hypothetical protein
MDEKKALNVFTPAELIRAARSAHPAFRYALVVAGLAAIVATVLKFGLTAPTLIFGTVILVVLMALFLMFATAAALPREKLAGPAMAFVYAVAIFVILSVTLLFTSTFFDMPLPLKTRILGGESGPATKASQLSEEEETALGLILADPRAGDRGVWVYPLHQQLTYRGFSDAQATTVLNGLVSKGVLQAVDVPAPEDPTGGGSAPAYRVTPLGFSYAKNSKRLKSFKAEYIYFVTLRGTKEHNQPFLNQLLSLQYVQKQTRFIIEDDPKLSRIAVFCYQPLDQETLRNMAQMFGVEVVSSEEQPD